MEFNNKARMWTGSARERPHSKGEDCRSEGNKRGCPVGFGENVLRKAAEFGLLVQKRAELDSQLKCRNKVSKLL